MIEHRLARHHALENARRHIEVRGGIGFSAACDAHLYLPRPGLYQNVWDTNGLSESD
jgi:hypothetical protein